jgi:hypothetical protein
MVVVPRASSAWPPCRPALKPISCAAMRRRQNFPAANCGCTACSVTHCTASSVVQYPSPFWLPSGRGHGVLSELELRAPSTSGDATRRARLSLVHYPWRCCSPCHGDVVRRAALPPSGVLLERWTPFSFADYQQRCEAHRKPGCYLGLCGLPACCTSWRRGAMLQKHESGAQ